METRSEGRNRGVSKAFVSFLRHKQQTAQRAKLCQTCCQMHQMFFTHKSRAQPPHPPTLPPPSPVFFLLPVSSSLSFLIRSNLTTLHGRIRNKVTCSAVVCFTGSALFVSLLLCLCCSNVSHLFQDSCF